MDLAPRTNPLFYPACQKFMTLIMQNKPNLLNTQMNVNKVLTNDYNNEQWTTNNEQWTIMQNKPNQTLWQKNVNPTKLWLKEKVW